MRALPVTWTARLRVIFLVSETDIRRTYLYYLLSLTFIIPGGEEFLPAEIVAARWDSNPGALLDAGARVVVAPDIFRRVRAMGEGAGETKGLHLEIA